MAGFDPDAYLASTGAAPVAGFDPDAYLGTAPATPVQKAQQLGANAAQITPVGALEGAANVITGMGSSAVGGLAGLAGTVLPGPPGQGAQWSQVIQEAGTYKPRTQEGSTVARIMGLPIEALGAITKPGGSYLDQMLGNKTPVLETAGEVYPAALATILGGVKPVRSIATTEMKPMNLGEKFRSSTPYAEQVRAEQAATKSAASWDNAAQIEAAQLAQKHGILVDPSISNPTAGNAVVNALTGKSNVAAILNKKNVPQWGRLTKQDLGMPKETALHGVNGKQAYELVREKLSGPYEEVRKLGDLDVAPANVNALNKVRPEDIPGSEAVNGKVNQLVDSVQTKLTDGITGDIAVTMIQKYRAEANSILSAQRKGGVIPPDMKAIADAKMQIAKHIEDVIEGNINSPKGLSDFRNSRQGMAKSYAYEQATDFNTGRVDPQKIASITAGDNSYTGTLADIGKIAGNFPSVAEVAPGTVGGTIKTHLARTGPAAGIGFSLGGIPGAILGAGIGELGGMLTAKRIASPAYQAKHAVPTDYRLPVEPTVRPAEAPYTAPQGGSQVVPYNYAQTINDQNFVMGQPEPLVPAPNVQATGVRMEQSQLGYRTAKEAVLEKEAARSAAARAAAEAQAAAEVPPAIKVTDLRKSTGVVPNKQQGGMLFDLDPITGRLRAADQGVKGATPEIWQANTGANLKSASEKVAAGKAFDMTAAEKVAWNKTAVDIQEALPEFKGLTDKQVMSKMADRQWVQDTIAKVQQKAQMFAELEKRSNDRVAQSMARIQREKMLDMLEQLQDTLGSRPVSSGAQGPKTRAFQRGLLTGENQ